MVARAVAEEAAEAAVAAEVVEVAVEAVVVVAVARRQTTCQATSGMPSVLKSNRPFVTQGTQLVLGPSTRWRLLTLTKVETRRRRSRRRIERGTL